MSNTLQSMSSFIRISSGRLFRFPVNKSNLLILVCTVDILYGSLYLMESIDNLIIFRVVFTFYPHSNISWLISRFLALHFPFCFLQISICSSVSFFVRVSVVWMFSLCKCLTNFPVSEFYGQTFPPLSLPFLSQFPWRFPRHVSMFFSSRIFQSVTFTCLLSLLSSISRTENPSYLCQSPLDFFFKWSTHNITLLNMSPKNKNYWFYAILFHFYTLPSCPSSVQPSCPIRCLSDDDSNCVLLCLQSRRTSPRSHWSQIFENENSQDLSHSCSRVRST